ncbi:hypothetical protein B0T17DRAFT_309690 [Bombardia bombarda]|uniref:Uncharacterized protein n=1 Tax=Bombardia bombarda TaxID=252184 RepID=A0AA39WUZ4_9PEZI|nr:hypothetical protein B0T17DRAFT_309690 [Bombardia bombarda]
MSEYGNPAVARAFWASVPPSLQVTLKTGIWLYIFLWVLDIGQLTVACLAYSGAVTDPGSVSRTNPKLDIKFPAVGHHIQRLIIAWAALGVIVHVTLACVDSINVNSRAPRRDEKGYAWARGVVWRWFLPWSVLSLGVWGVCVGLQTANYVPNLGRLDECRRFPALSQCGLVLGSWVIGIVYIGLHLGVIIWIAVLLTTYRMTYVRRAERSR